MRVEKRVEFTAGFVPETCGHEIAGNAFTILAGLAHALPPAFRVRAWLAELPAHAARGFVHPGHEHIVPFGRDEQAEVAQWLHGLMTALPAGAEISGVSLASPGAACRHCPIRHTCSAYLKIAPSWWLKYPSDFGQIPIDTWGVVTETKTEESGISVKIRDAAERSVKVAGLLDRHQLGLDLLGQNLFFFNLVFTGTGRDRGGRRFFPHGFHEKPRDRGEWQAWSLRVFCG